MLKMNPPQPIDTKPAILRWAEGAALIRSAPDLIAEQLAWAGYFAMTAGIDNGDNVPVGEVDALFVAHVFLTFGAAHDKIRAALQSAPAEVAVPMFERGQGLLEIEAAQAVLNAVDGEPTQALLRLCLSALSEVLQRGDRPVVSLDLRYFCSAAIQALTPVEYLEAILAGEDFRDL